MTNTKKYMGFIPGYKARNIASMEETISVHVDSIIFILKKLKSKARTADLKKKVERTISILDDLNEFNTIDKLLSVTEMLRNYLSEFLADNLIEEIRTLLLELGQLTEILDDSKLRTLVYTLGQELIPFDS